MHPVIVNELQQQQLQSMRKPSSLLLVSLLDLYYTICSSKHVRLEICFFCLLNLYT